VTPVPGLRRCNLGVSAVLLAGLAVAGCVGRAPVPTQVAPAVTPTLVAVLPGDTVRAIARRNDVDWQELARANGLAAPYTIRPGQQLMLPLRLPPPVPVGAAIAQAPDPVATAPVSTLAEGARSVVAEPLAPPGAAPAAAPVAPQPVSAPPLAETLPLPPDLPGAFVLPASIGGVPVPPVWPDDAPVAETDLRAIAEAPPPPGAQRWTRGSGRFAWPVRGRVVSTFGRKGGGLVNDGVNIAAPLGTPIRAAHAGTVVYVGNEVRGFGNLILIRDASGVVTAYAHADAVAVRQGQSVREGQVIGRVGSTGAVNTPQLHFQVRRDGRPVDPMRYLGGQVAGG
jgi:murein DD-endopeptidase MepM/ murein hydrolase activator NlpD